jgi:hypothetical protein
MPSGSERHSVFAMSDEPKRSFTAPRLAILGDVLCGVDGTHAEVDGAWTSPRGHTDAFARPILGGGDNRCTSRQVPAVSPGAGSTASRSQQGAAADLALALVASG